MGNDTGLTIEIRTPVQSVSLLSSLLRTLQAAVRDAAQRTDVGEKLLASQSAPVLQVRISSPAGGPLKLTFTFGATSDGTGGDTLDSAGFRSFLEEIAAALKATPQRTLWGTPFRPLIRSSAENERLRLFLEDLARVGDAVVEYGDRKIRLLEGRVEVD